MTFLLLPLLLLTTPHSHATRRDQVVLRAERTLASGREQAALILESPRARLTLNSNFLNRNPSASASVGLFEMINSDQISAWHLHWKQVSLRLQRSRAHAERISAPAPSKGVESPHRIRLYLDRQELNPENLGYQQALDLLTHLTESQQGWTPRKTVTIRCVAPGKVITFPESIKSVCKLAGSGRLSCLTAPLGVATVFCGQ